MSRFSVSLFVEFRLEAGEVFLVRIYLAPEGQGLKGAVVSPARPEQLTVGGDDHEEAELDRGVWEEVPD
jgi:hypothetical protein